MKYLTDLENNNYNLTEIQRSIYFKSINRGRSRFIRDELEQQESKEKNDTDGMG